MRIFSRGRHWLDSRVGVVMPLENFEILHKRTRLAGVNMGGRAQSVTH